MKNTIFMILLGLFSLNVFAGNLEEIKAKEQQLLSQLEEVQKVKNEVLEQNKPTVDKVTETLDKVVDGVNKIDGNNLVTFANNAADALIVFGSKLGIAVKDILFSWSGFFVILLGILYFQGKYLIALVILSVYATVVNKKLFNTLKAKHKEDIHHVDGEMLVGYTLLYTIVNIPTLILVMYLLW